jgi:serine/threonine protein kinase
VARPDNKQRDTRRSRSEPYLEGGSSQWLGEASGALLTAAQAGSVQGLIDRHKRASSEPPFGERLCRSIFRGICEGLREFHTHSPPWAHRDIKPANILVAPSRNFEPCLTDFGSAGAASAVEHKP